MINRIKKLIIKIIYRKEIKKCKENPVYFINKYLDIELKPHQEKIINTVKVNNKIIVKAPRQSGKTTTIINSVVHDLVFGKRITVGLKTLKTIQDRELLKSIANKLENLPAKFNIDFIAKPNDRLILDNGNCLVLRENFVDYLYLDEFAFFPLKNIYSSYYQYLMNQKTIIISTKNPGSIFNSIFYDTRYQDRFIPLEIKFEDVPGNTPERKEEIIRNIGIVGFVDKYC